MSTKAYLFGVSVVLNVCLAMVTIRLLTHVSPSPMAGSGTGDSDSLDQQQSANAPAEGAFPSEFRWSNVESSDLHALVRNLRAAGCPEELVRDVVEARVGRLFATKLAQAKALAPRSGYWEHPRAWSTNTAALERKLFAEKTALLKELLGVDPKQDNQKTDPAIQVAQERFAFLPEEKRGQLQALESKYSELERLAYANANGLITQTERDALASVQQQRAAELNALLTPDEKTEYDLRNSLLSQRLRSDLGPFQPSETEFRAIYRAQAGMDAQQAIGSAGGSNSDLEATFQAALRVAIGDARYAEYERCQDPGYQSLLKIAERYSLPHEAAAQVFDLKLGTEAQTRQVMANPGVAAEQKQAWVQAARAQTERTLADILGAQGFSVYRDVSGDWIERLGQ